MCDVHFVNNPTPLEAKDHFEIVINSKDDISSSDDDSLYNENIEYVEASPYDSELVNLEVAEIVIPEVEKIKDDNLREKLLNVHLLIANIEALKDNSTPSSDTTTHSNISLPDYEVFPFYDGHIEEIYSGSTTTHYDISLSEYDSFIFDLSNDQFTPTDRSDFANEEFDGELAHIISPPEYDRFDFWNLPDLGELISILNSEIRENLSSTTCVNLPIEDDHSPLLAYVIHDRLHKLISQLEIIGVSLSQEDVNLKFLRSQPTEWKTHTLIWRNKTDLEEQSLYDLFNSLKIYEAEVKNDFFRGQEGILEQIDLLSWDLICPRWSVTTAIEKDTFQGSVAMTRVFKQKRNLPTMLLWPSLLQVLLLTMSDGSVYKVVKALYGLHQTPRAWYETLANYLLENGFQRGKIDQTLFIKWKKGDIILVQIYVDDIIFGSTNKDLCKAFETLMKDKFQMSSMGELTFFLGLQVKQKKDEIFISQDKYVAEILRKFSLTEGKSASTPIDTEKPLLKDPDGVNTPRCDKDRLELMVFLLPSL
nr:putative ribonuclease H-like domain-containing protein [Tanacetum cinerariifolium]